MKLISEIRNYSPSTLEDLLVYLNTNSAFYKEHFAKHNIDISEIKTLDDLKKIPVTTKQDLQMRNDDFICVDKNKIIEYCCTSGTMGAPVNIALTENDMKRLAYNEYLSYLTIGSNSSDIFQIMLSLDRQFMAGIAYYSGIRKLGATAIRSGPGNFAMQIDIIHRLHPNILIAVPSFILNLIKYAASSNIDLNKTSVQKIICIGENIRNEDFSLNELAQRIVKEWNVGLYSTFASTELQTAFTECSFGRGGHHHRELVVFEILDEHDQALPPGNYGELTITTLGVEGMPLLRYKTGDICAYFNDPCPCGENTLRISPIIGRKYQLIKYNGTTFYPQTIFNLLNKFDFIDDYLIQLSKNDIGTDEILIYIAILNITAHQDQIIRQTIQSHLRVLPQINYLSLSDIQKMQLSNEKRKISKIIDIR